MIGNTLKNYTLLHFYNQLKISKKAMRFFKLYYILVEFFCCLSKIFYTLKYRVAKKPGILEKLEFDNLDLKNLEF